MLVAAFVASLFWMQKTVREAHSTAMQAKLLTAENLQIAGSFARIDQTIIDQARVSCERDHAIHELLFTLLVAMRQKTGPIPDRFQTVLSHQLIAADCP